MTTYTELLAQREALARQSAELDKALRAAQREAQAKVIADIKKLMADHGLTADDLGGAVGKRGQAAGTKVAAKYRNNETGETWTGRGLKPKWLKSALEAGRKIEDFQL